MTNLISQTFKDDKKKLVTFITGGDPDLKTSLKIIKTIINNGADIIEIGMPFSDPMADGPTIQKSSNRAISAGSNLSKTLKIINKFRKFNSETPIVLMGYFNPIFQFGLEKFFNSCKERSNPDKCNQP